jgi:hypothetical protein
MAVLWEALAWAKRELRVFGLPLGSKVPDVSFPELATTDPIKIAQIWRDAIYGTKDLNIGVLCGNGIVIVDIDTKHDKKFNRSAIANFEKAGGHFNTLVVKTASGGFQVYYRIPKDKAYANMTDMVPGVDIRCENGYGIAPGSFSLESGGNYELYNDAEIAEIPPELLALLKPVKTRKERFNGHADSEKAIPLYVDYLQRVEPAIEGQGGDTHTYNVACMGVRDYGLTTVTVALLMLEHFNPRCEPPWDADELIHKVENADSYAIGDEGSRDPVHILESVEYTPPPVQPNALVPANGHVFVPGRPKQLMAEKNIPMVNWLVYPMIVPRDVTMTVGPGGVGKSTFLIALACHAAVGKDFGPYKIKRPIDVLLYNPEDNEGQISGRAAVTCTQHGLDWDEVRLHLDIMDQESEMLTLVEADNGRNTHIPKQAEEYFTEYKNNRPTCELIIVDPLRKVLSGLSENDNAQMSLAMRFLGKFAQRLGVGLVLSHHTVKNLMLRKDLDPDSPDLSVGAGSVVSSARQVVNILPQTPEDIDRHGKHTSYFSTRVSKSNHGPSGEVTWWDRRIIRAANGGLYPTPVLVDIQTSAVRLYNDYVNYIGDAMSEQSKNTISVSEAATIVFRQVKDIPVKSLTETVRRLFDRGGTQRPYTDIYGNAYIMMLETEGKRHEVVLVAQTGFKTPPPATMTVRGYEIVSEEPEDPPKTPQESPEDPDAPLEYLE